ncbi:MAG: hypothetical protein R3B09_04035 [Nannocystaceae bacterium]
MKDTRLRRYLRREVTRSHRFLDHGVLAPSIAVGAPHLYRVGLQIGLLDHLTLGATLHWLPSEPAPRWSPLIAVAFYRNRWAEVGAHYFRLLYPPPRDDKDPTTLSFQRKADFVMATVAFSQAWFTAGFDLGWARGLEAADQPSTADPINQSPIVRDRLAAGLHARVGSRRFGVAAQVTWPFVSAELALDLRFGLFEVRPKGRWWEN